VHLLDQDGGLGFLGPPARVLPVDPQEQVLVGCYFPEDRVLAVEVLALSESDEELALIGVGSRVGHAEDAGFVMGKLGMEFVLELATEYTLSPRPAARGVSALKAEMLGQSVELGVVVVP
jgi:hypothetical protein